MKFVNLSAIVLTALSLAATGSAYSAERFAYERVYYSDASMTDVVGEEFVGCNMNNRQLVGDRSFYSNTLWEVDCNVVPGQDPCDNFVERVLRRSDGSLGWTCPF